MHVCVVEYTSVMQVIEVIHNKKMKGGIIKCMQCIICY